MRSFRGSGYELPYRLQCAGQGPARRGPAADAAARRGAGLRRIAPALHLHDPAARGRGRRTEPRQDPKARPLRARGLRHRRAVVDPDVGLRRAALRLVRGYPALCRRVLRDRVRLYHHRREHPDGYRGHGPRLHVLAPVHPLDRRHGRAGLHRGHPARVGRPLHAHHARRGPRAGGQQAGAARAQDRAHPVPDLPRHDDDRGGAARLRRDELLRRAAALLRHGRHGRLLHPGGQHRGLQQRLSA